MKELSRGIRINILSNFLRFSRAGFYALAASVYGLEAFGVYTVAWATLEILIRFGYLGLDQGLLFELAHFRKTDAEEKLYGKIAASLKVCFGVGLLAAAALGGYARLFIDTPAIRQALYILAPALPVYLAGTLLVQATMGLKEMKYAAWIRAGAEPFSVMFFALVLLPLGASGLIWAQALSLWTTALLSVWAFHRFFSLRKVMRACRLKVGLRALLAYSFPMQMIELYDALFYRMDIYFITAFLGTGTPEQKALLGAYGLAKQVARVIIQTKTAFGQIFAPVTSESFLAEDVGNLLQQVRYAMKKLILLNIPFVLFLSFFGPDILRLIGGDAGIIKPAAYYWLLAGQFCYSNSYLLMLLLVTTRRAARFLAVSLLLLGLAFPAGVFLVGSHGAVGAAVLTFLAYFGFSLAALVEVAFRLFPNLQEYPPPASESPKYPQS